LRLLLDTHAFLWWLAGDQALSDAAREAITDPDNEVFVSAASAWEIAPMYRLGRLPGAAVIAGAVASQGFTELPINIRDGQAAGGLPAASFGERGALERIVRRGKPAGEVWGKEDERPAGGWHGI
jgi:PIN domain nuclease of toxin-antitoxin system